MNLSPLRKFPITLMLILSNVGVFLFCYYRIGTFEHSLWWQGLLFSGAEFAPLTLDKEWYRLFTHLFMHGNVMHLLFNMYALFSVGSEVEQVTGAKKFLWIYFLCGFTASLASLYFNLFTIGVGASGAIFGLFGFSLVVQLAESRKNDHPVMPIVVNFIIFLVVNLLFAKALNADNSAHMGGLAGGFILGTISLFNTSYRTMMAEYLLLPVCVSLFFALPRYPVTYFKFFQKVLNIEDSTSHLFKRKNISDEDFLNGFKRQYAEWDTARTMLDAHTYLPLELQSDTAKLKHYIALRKQEAAFRINLIEKESYRYFDSIAWVQEKVQPYTQLEHPLTMMRPIKKEEMPDSIPPFSYDQVQVWYNDEWEELPGPPGTFYRIGQRDSLGQWQGPVRDFYKNGTVQMKGSYEDNQRDGVFLYYSDHNTYESAGRYDHESAVGKWERFHHNGNLMSEEYYRDGYFMKSMWDSVGNQLVKDGTGRYVHHYDNGVISEEGEYREGRKQGTWYGRHANGSMYFEEYFNNGRLVSGRSRTRDGQTYVYDESSFFPMPEGGNVQLVQYLTKRVNALNPTEHGRVHLLFRVTTNSVITDFDVVKSLNKELDAKAIEFIKEGPKWIPAREHGHLKQTGWGSVSVEF
jgi:membrane associated rhomboid family serine protease/antitoxin component YwqK of YwqJK toxin-antitoxin module